MKYLFLFLFTFSQISFAAPIVRCDVCLTNQEHDEVVKQLDELIKANVALLEKVKQLEEIQRASPDMQLEPLVITIDKDGRVFIKDQLVGKLKIGDLTYDVSMKLNTTIVRSKQAEYGFNLKLKAGVVQNYERLSTSEIKTYTSGALAIEPYYYRYFNLNAVVGPRLYGPAIGIDVTEHLAALIGLGFLYNDNKTFFIGTSFDF